jgi:hypothetical protein
MGIGVVGYLMPIFRCLPHTYSVSLGEFAGNEHGDMDIALSEGIED